MTPQVRISYQLSAACAAAGVLMVMGGLMGAEASTHHRHPVTRSSRLRW